MESVVDYASRGDRKVVRGCEITAETFDLCAIAIGDHHRRLISLYAAEFLSPRNLSLSLTLEESDRHYQRRWSDARPGYAPRALDSLFGILSTLYFILHGYRACVSFRLVSRAVKREAEERRPPRAACERFRRPTTIKTPHRGDGCVKENGSTREALIMQ